MSNEPKHIIDCDKEPNISYEGWTIESHKKMGKLKWNPKNVELYLSEKQKDGYISGINLQKELENKLVLNACVLDYLLKHQNLIPDSWKGRYIFFWGTIYRNSNGYLFVRCLFWCDGGWYWGSYWRGVDWVVDCPAALRAS
jgi:hypothetical protein